MESDSVRRSELRRNTIAGLEPSVGIGVRLTTASTCHSPHQPPAFSTSRDRRSVEPNTSALVLASEWRLQYRTLRCAARCFDRIYVLGTKEARPLAHSLSCQAFHHLPFEEGFDSTSVPFINRLTYQLSIDWVIPSDARTTRFLTENGAMLGPNSYPVPDTATFDLLNDKSTFISLCRKLEIPTPQTEVLADKQQLLSRIQDGHLKLPLVAKPIDREGSQGVMLFHSGKALGMVGRLRYEPIMAQEFIGGRDICAFYFCRKGKIELEALYHHGGHFLEFIEHRDISRQCRRIIEATKYDGVIGFDVRQRDTSDFYFLECNPRFWYNMELTMLAGLNFVEVGVKVPKLCNQPLKTSLAGKVIVRPSGLLRKFPAPQAVNSNRLAVLAYLADDLPMMMSIGINKIQRKFESSRGDSDPS
jgi:ATP-grasp in the biosynthetic pathway with Ter operon